MDDEQRNLYWLVKRRRTPTLARWWHELNCWKWPKEIPDPEDERTPDHPRRRVVMDAIVREVGVRTILSMPRTGR